MFVCVAGGGGGSAVRGNRKCNESASGFYFSLTIIKT